MLCEVALFQVDICDFIVVSGTMDPKGKGKMVDVQPEVSDEPLVSDDSFERMLREASDHFARKKMDSSRCSYITNEVQSERLKDVVQEDVTHGLESIDRFDNIREVECSSDDASYSAATESSDTDDASYDDTIVKTKLYC